MSDMAELKDTRKAIHAFIDALKTQQHSGKNVKIVLTELLSASPTPPEALGESVDVILEKIKALPRYSFLSPPEGGVRRCADKSGDWIERYEVIKLMDDYALIPSIEQREG
jgi:hypothetical protein